MDVVWVAKFKNNYLLNSRGQSAVEYIFLIAILSALAFSVFNNRRFKEFMAGKGFFESIRRGMEYSYRYGRELKVGVDYDRAMDFNYTTRDHDTYFNNEEVKSRFFAPADKYGTE